MLPPGQQAHARNLRHRVRTREAHEHLIAHHRTADDEAERVEPRPRPDIGKQGAHMKRRATLAHDLHMIETRLVAKLHLKRGIDLIIRSFRPFVALDQAHAGAGADHRHRSGEDRRGRLAGRHEQEMDGTLDLRPGSDLDHHAVARKRRIQRQRRFVVRQQGAEVGR